MIEYLVSVLTIGVIVCIFTLGLNVRFGWAGELDLAFYAFVAIGAYMSAVIQLPRSNLTGGAGWILGLSLPFPIAVLGGVACSVVASLVIGAIALRKLRGDYFAITTVAFFLIIFTIFGQVNNLFDGFNGLYGLQQPFESQLNLDQGTYQWFFLGMCVVVLLIVYGTLELLSRSPFGRGLRSIREDETAAAAFGRNVYVEKLKAYVIGGACAGLGGALLCQYLTAWSPNVWGSVETFLLYSAIFVGGVGNSRGVLIGTFIALVFIPEVTRFLPTIPTHPDIEAAVRNVVGAILIVVVVKFRPQGILREPRPRDGVRAEVPSAIAP